VPSISVSFPINKTATPMATEITLSGYGFGRSASKIRLVASNPVYNSLLSINDAYGTSLVGTFSSTPVALRFYVGVEITHNGNTYCVPGPCNQTASFKAQNAATVTVCSSIQKVLFENFYFVNFLIHL